MVEKLGYILIDEYFSNLKRRVVIRDKIGYKYNVGMAHLTDPNRGTRIVDKSNPFSLENISLWLKINKPEFELCKDNIYERNSKKLRFYHNIKTCKEYFYCRWANIVTGQGCGVCHGKQMGERTSLLFTHSKLSLEWHPTKNGDLSPKDVSKGSHKKVWWLCFKGHEYFSAIYGRVKGNGCLVCSIEKQESFVATEIKKWCKEKFKHVDSEHKMFKNPETNQWLRCDIYIGESKNTDGVYIEVHGGQHYRFNSKFHRSEKDFEDSKYRDKIKKKYAKENGTYVEVDLRKIKTTEQAIEYIEKIIRLH